MPRHRYRAALADGRMQRGELDALNLADLEARLGRIGLTLINGEPVRHRFRRRPQRIPRRELAAFCFHLEQLLAAGIPILDALSELRDSSTQPGLRAIITDLVDSIAAGQPLSTACAAHPDTFDSVFVSLLRVGEQTGKLPRILQEIANSIARADELASHARRIAIYPAIVATVLLLAVWVALVFVVPEVARLFQGIGQPLPAQTRLLIAVSDFVTQHGALLLAAAAATAVLAPFTLRTNPALRLRADTLLLRLPIIGRLLHDIVLARVCNLLALMHDAGIPIIEALDATADTARNRLVRLSLQQAARRIGEGHTLSDAIAAAPVFPALLVRMLHVGEQGGALDTILGHAARYYEREVREAVGTLQASLEPLLTVLLGGLMLWIMSAILGPVYDLLGHLPL